MSLKASVPRVLILQKLTSFMLENYLPIAVIFSNLHNLRSKLSLESLKIFFFSVTDLNEYFLACTETKKTVQVTCCSVVLSLEFHNGHKILVPFSNTGCT